MTAIDTTPPVQPTSTPTRLLVDPQGEALEAVRVCEADVFDARFGDGREVLDEWFETHEHASVFLSLASPDGVSVAATRVILPSSAGLKLDQSLVEDWAVDPDMAYASVGLDRATTWEIGSISVRPRVRGAGLTWTAALLHGLMELTTRNGATAVVAVLDEGARTLISRFGIHFRAFPGCDPRPYCGSPASTPVYAVIQGVRDYQRRAEPEAYRLITLGAGLDDVALPDRDDYELSPHVLDLRDDVRVTSTGG